MMMQMDVKASEQQEMTKGGRFIEGFIGGS